MSIQTASTARADLVRLAFILEWLTLAWVILEATLGIWASLEARSVSLMAFGADSVIEALSACVLLWRLNVELRDGHAFSEEAERKASRLGGVFLFALAYVVASAAWGLWMREGQEFSPIGLAIAAATIPVMYVLAKRKIAVAGRLAAARCGPTQWKASLAPGFLLSSPPVSWHSLRSGRDGLISLPRSPSSTS